METEVIPKINEAIHSGLAVLDSAFVTVEITPEREYIIVCCNNLLLYIIDEFTQM